MNSQFNQMITLGEKKSRKGDGATAILTLMGSMLDFLDKVDVCVEAQIKPQNKQRIVSYKEQIEQMYTELAEMSKEAIQSVTDPEAEVTDDGITEGPAEVEVTEKETVSTPVMVNAPVVPKI